MAQDSTAQKSESTEPAPAEEQPSKTRRTAFFIGVVAVVALVTAGVVALLVNIFQRKREGDNPYVLHVKVDEWSTDPEVWKPNFPRQYDQYKRTTDATRTNYGGSDAMPSQKLEKDPWLKRMFSGYAFSIDYRDRRGHAYMLHDQEVTRRVTDKPQPGACLHCHASVIPTYARIGMERGGASKDDYWGAVAKGFPIVSGMKYTEAHAELLKTPDGSPSGAAPAASGAPSAAPTTQQALAGHHGDAHPVSCVDCHSPKDMSIRVTRPGFITGIAALKAKQGIANYDVNRDATRQEMRSFVCGQCHVEYYFKGEQKVVTFPWANGLKVEEIEAYYEKEGFTDWKHGETGAPMLKAQHPEFELWNQGTHARAGVACADCHMPYMRQGALKISDHWVRSPLLNINRACQVCHQVPESELLGRAQTIQDRNHALMQRAATSLVEMIDAIKLAKANGATEEALKDAYQMHRKAQWRLDFVAAENSMGFHAPQEAARILGEAIDYARQGQLAAQKLMLQPDARPATQPTPPVEGVTPSEKAPVQANPQFPTAAPQE